MSSTLITAELLEEILIACKGATPGPWTPRDVSQFNKCWMPSNGYENDYKFIAICNPSTVQALVGRVKELEKDLGNSRRLCALMVPSVEEANKYLSEHHGEINSLTAENEVMKAALTKIADTDFRGNKSAEITIAQDCLKKVGGK